MDSDVEYSLRMLDCMIKSGEIASSSNSSYGNNFENANNDDMEEVTRAISNNMISIPPQFKKRYRKKEKWTEWWKSLRNNSNLSDAVNRFHNCYEQKCQMNKRIYNPETDIYICMDSGLVHECNNGREKCPYVLTTNEGIHVCSISARDIGVVLKGDIEDKRESYAEYGKVGVEGEQAKLSNTELNRSVGANREKQQRCEYLLSPSNRKKLIGQPSVKTTQSPGNSSSIIKAKLKNIERDPLGTRNPLSPYYIKESAESEIKTEINNCFDKLFFNDEVRDAIKKEKIETFRKTWQATADAYFKKCYANSTKIQILDLDQIFSVILNKSNIPERCHKDKREVDFIKGTISETWKILRNTKVILDKPTFAKDKFIYGILYIMNDTESEHLYWLKKWLPPSTELKRYTSTTHKITNCIRDLKKTFMKSETREKLKFVDLELLDRWFKENHNGRPFVLSWLIK